MWALNAGGSETIRDILGDDFWIVNALYGERYQVEVLTFRNCGSNKYRLIRFVNDPSTPKPVYKKEVVGEFDTSKELVAIAKLVLASGSSNYGEAQA